MNRGSLNLFCPVVLIDIFGTLGVFSSDGLHVNVTYSPEINAEPVRLTQFSLIFFGTEAWISH